MTVLSTRLALLVALTVLLIGGASAQVVLETAFPGTTLTEPVELTGDGSGRVYVAEKAGLIRTFEPRTALIALDIRSLVQNAGEQGLLGLAFHPDYARNGYAYVHYSGRPDGRTVVARYTRSAAGNPATLDPASALVLLEVPQPYDNHNGGKIAFGPDGFLYVALGDGGSGGDPGNRAQNRTTLLGKILRLDVDRPAAPLNYGIPADNPFVGRTDGSRAEIYALGLRNPFKFSFDRATGALWAGDVGQGEWEEVDRITNGGNYGWKIREGAHCFSPAVGCATAGLTDPVYEYSHAGGACSIAGGAVYRGSQIPSLVGEYVFGDYCLGDVWALSVGDAAPRRQKLASVGYGLIGFGEDGSGGLYVLHQDGRVLRLASAGTAAEERPGEAPALRLAGANPFADQTTVEVAAGVAGHVRATLHDALGRRVAVLLDGPVATGEARRVTVDGTSLAAGVYVVRLTGPDGARAVLRLLRRP